MKLVRATLDDEARVRDFFEQRTLPGAVDVKIQRPLGVFEHYRLISDDFETLLLTDDDDSIAGMASLIFREGHVLGEKQTWGFATDLRIAPTRRAIAQWAQYFLPVLERAGFERNCRYVFSAVGHQDNPAYNALIRPTSHTRRRMPRYLLANRFRTVTLHGRIPFSAKPLSSIHLKVLETGDLEAACVYLREQARHKPLATQHTPESFAQEVTRWPGLRLSDFRLAMDSQKRIRGLAALYDSRITQKLLPETYNGFANTTHQLLWLASFSGMVRSFSNVGQVLPTQFLTFLASDSAEIFHCLVDDAFNRLAPRELLSYTHFRGNWRTLPPSSFVSTSLPYGLYLLLSPNAEAPPWPVPSVRSLPPDFEAVWL